MALTRDHCEILMKFEATSANMDVTLDAYKLSYFLIGAVLAPTKCTQSAYFVSLSCYTRMQGKRITY